MLYCGPDPSWPEVVEEGTLIRAPGSALCEAGVNDAARGSDGPVVIALSGFSR